ncbi:unnamed protein product (mitochondrion) [Plasmodiophora brassicae]|uniref:Uncharacterized protein n=1 Tax=Plasmodiophora brassicae TaxID=37360 RepID=A0A0G4ILX8_PLABS|nr:hypothetical protein PBRA_004786 [Plasmodiophora brassicae]SPQ93359.1 unnamed protein product [Plasmodiophora brassicae]
MVPRAYVLAIGLALASSIGASEATVDLVVNTWAFTAATDAAWRVMMKDGARAVDVVEAGCATCEEEQCGGTVGWGGSPDENGETTLDAMIMDGTTMNAGSVAALRQVGNAVAVARAIMEGTEHTTLCGSQATDFASTALGMTPRDISSARSRAAHDEWKANNCQPNFWAKSGQIRPDSTLHCGPYKFGRSNGHATREPVTTSHDTISMVAIAKGNVASATSTNGATFKISGRVGDGPIIGSGSYADTRVGGCGSTGDGDIMMRFLPCYQAVENMRLGMSPTEAARDAINRIADVFPHFNGAVIAVNVDGMHGAATHGFDPFPYSFRFANESQSSIAYVHPHRGRRPVATK